ncbi:MAG: hypothetical protein IPP47_07645, partial [Bryobacterales bacterium]|nr:hypothetical protein [Bryobacterales bacterium]
SGSSLRTAAVAATLANPWPSNFPYPTPPSGFAFDRNLRTPYMQQWSFGCSNRLAPGGWWSSNYAGSKGTRLYGARDINQPGPPPQRRTCAPTTSSTTSTGWSRSNSSYHSCKASARQQLRRGLTFFAGYTWAKSIDDASGFFPSAGDPNFPQDSRNLSAERGRSNFDVRHRLAASASWLIGRGFTLNGILTMQSGRPFTVALPSGLDNSGTGRSSLGFGANDRPSVSGDASPPAFNRGSAGSTPPPSPVRARHLWKCRPQHPQRAGAGRIERLDAQVVPRQREPLRADARRGVQPSESHQL